MAIKELKLRLGAQITGRYNRQFKEGGKSRGALRILPNDRLITRRELEEKTSMFARLRFWPIALTVNLLTGVALAQTTPPAKTGGNPVPPPAATPAPLTEAPPSPDAVAAVVNGQTIPELAVFRGLLRVTPAQRDRARAEVLNFLIDTAVVDQYLTQLKIQVDAKEIEEHLQRIKDEAKKAGQEYSAMLKKLYLTEDDLRRELGGQIRWDKFVLHQATDKALRELFDKNVEMFNGARVRARHILVPIAEGKKTDAEARVLAIRKQLEAQVAQEMAKLASTDKITVEKERAGAMEKAFAAAAARESICPSKAQGGDVGEFYRIRTMVEPFARAAFALKPYQLSEPVATEFGMHLILVTDHQQGKDLKFDDVDVRSVRDVYGDRLREAILTSYKPKSRIEIREKKGPS
jgi:peptidyl-prolyl cis-trans isomerase C